MSTEQLVKEIIKGATAPTVKGLEFLKENKDNNSENNLRLVFTNLTSNEVHKYYEVEDKFTLDFFNDLEGIIVEAEKAGYKVNTFFYPDYLVSFAVSIKGDFDYVIDTEDHEAADINDCMVYYDIETKSWNAAILVARKEITEEMINAQLREYLNKECPVEEKIIFSPGWSITKGYTSDHSLMTLVTLHFNDSLKFESSGSNFGMGSKQFIAAFNASINYYNTMKEFRMIK